MDVKRFMSENLKDAIISISKGNSTRLKIGSRAVPHRLRKDERLSVARALDTGFIELYSWSRINPSNIYEKMCGVSNKRPVFCMHDKKHSTIYYKKENDSELVPTELIGDHYPYEIKDKFVLVHVADRKNAKIFAQSLSNFLNSN